MKSTFFLLSSFLVAAVHGSAVLETRTTGNYVQDASGNAAFTIYSNCGTPACGQPANGYTASMNQLSFGAPPGQGPGDACGRCFAVTGTADPYSESGQPSTFNTIVVKVTDLCTDGQYCDQTTSNPVNSLGQPMHFQLCQDTGATGAFFPSGSSTLIGTFQEVACSQWSGSDGSLTSSNGCLAGETAGFWPDATGCGNQGAHLSPM
ncbi:endoglucanase V-like protein [Lactarius quietus]|nr:endoglucanase V-like protein [Lactarius quietus]